MSILHLRFDDLGVPFNHKLAIVNYHGDMETLFSDGALLLYPLVFLIGLGGYLPQIYRLAAYPADTSSISLPTWYVWASSWLISLLYGVYHLHDPMFVAVATMNLAGHGGIIALTTYRRRQAALVRVRTSSYTARPPAP